MSVARVFELGMKLTAASIVFLASFMVESGVSLGYVMRTCRSGESAPTPRADAARSAGKTDNFIFINGGQYVMHSEVWMLANDVVVTLLDAGRCQSVGIPDVKAWDEGLSRTMIIMDMSVSRQTTRPFRCRRISAIGTSGCILSELTTSIYRLEPR